MGIVPTVFSTVAGVALIGLALHDVFHTLLRPNGTGRLAHLVFRAAWAAGRGRAWAGLVGSLTIVTVIGLWVALIALGWALVFLPHVPEGFAYSGIAAGSHHPFAEAVTISLVALTTLGYGDVVASQDALRLIVPLESLMGFVLLSASVSWFTQLYPALARRRSLALRLSAMNDAGMLSGLHALAPAEAAALVRSVGASFADSIADLAQNSELYYFSEQDPRMSLPRAAAYLIVLRDAARTSPDADVRAAGSLLSSLVDELGRLLRTHYPHARGSTPDAVLRNAALHHGHDVETFPDTP